MRVRPAKPLRYDRLTFNCARCGTRVTRFSQAAKYCGSTCRSRAYEERRAKR